MENTRGKLITFEGCDGCGKSTQARLLAEYLEEKHIPYLLTREPGGGKISEKIREIILDNKNGEMTNECEALLYAAARAQHLSDNIAPALKEGKIVICDRYIHSSYAYQGFARGLGREFVEKINAYAIENYLPDLTIFMDFTPEDAFVRKCGADQNDRIEQAGLLFHKKVYEGFLACVKKEPEKFFVINAKKNIPEIFSSILEEITKRGIL